jgi:hypothetical protein
MNNFIIIQYQNWLHKFKSFSINYFISKIFKGQSVNKNLFNHNYDKICLLFMKLLFIFILRIVNFIWADLFIIIFNKNIKKNELID